MHKVRIYVNRRLVIGQAEQLDDETAHHVSRVLRMHDHDTIHVFNGQGGYYLARIDTVGKRAVSIVPTEHIPGESESQLSITLAQGISRGQRMDYTIQKAVELGVRRIVPLLLEHSTVKLAGERSQSRLSHWQKIVISACQQCGRNRVPEVLPPVSLPEWVKEDGNEVKLLLHPEGALTLSQVRPRGLALTLLSGPEGGLSAKDLDFAAANDYKAVRLGPRILRTETAAVAAIAACQSLWGDMG